MNKRVEDADQNGDNQEPDAPEVEDQEEDEGETPESTEGSDAGEGAEDDEEVVVTLGDEESPTSDDEQQEQAPPWVKQLRKDSREKDKTIRDLKQQLQSRTEVQAPKPVEVGAKPTLADCDYDEDKFAEAVSEWADKKVKADKEAKERKDEADAAQAVWTARVGKYNEAKAKLKVQDYDVAEDAVNESMSVTQRGILVDGCDTPENAAALTYALGKNPKKLAELASIKNPVKFAFAVSKLESQLKVTPKKAAPLPEKVIRGNAKPTLISDAHLARLETEADRTGDRSKVIQYRKQLKAKRA